MMKLAAVVGLGKIFEKPKWFCFLTFSSKVSGGKMYHWRPTDHGKSCFTRGKSGIA